MIGRKVRAPIFRLDIWEASKEARPKGLKRKNRDHTTSPRFIGRGKGEKQRDVRKIFSWLLFGPIKQFIGILPLFPGARPYLLLQVCCWGRKVIFSAR
jgi:hypothetical protein